MLITSRYTYNFAKKQILFPSKLVLMNDVIKWDNEKQISVTRGGRASGSVCDKKFHNFEISHSGRSKLIKKINWLFQCAKSKHIKTYSGKEIYNFKVNFITLTLPSTQKHSTAVITKECFERFLNEMRTRCKMTNYIWRLEFQNNGNVHYHLVTDTFIDWDLVTSVWNRVVNYLGYVDDYTNKMNVLTLHEYCSMFPNEKFEVLQKRYIKGRSEKWKKPNSADCRSASNQHNIAMYIGKYFGKTKANQAKCNAMDNEDNSFALRLWFSSRSLSKLDTISQFVENANLPLEYIVSTCKSSLKVVHDYCTVIYFDFNELCNAYKMELGKLFSRYALEKKYTPSP